MRKVILIVCAIVLALIGAVFLWPKSTSEEVPPEEATNATLETQEEKSTIRLIAVGDMLPHDTVNLRAKTDTGYNYLPFFSEIDNYFASSDFAYCNQEAPSGGDSLGISGYPVFNAPQQFSKDLDKLGCNLLNLANNHVADKGTTGIEGTVNLWESLNVEAFGGANATQSQQNKIRIFNIDDKKVAFVSFTDLSNNSNIPAYSINMFSDNLVKSLMEKARNNSDYIIVSAHWGIEDSQIVASSQRTWAQLLSDEGADIILGAGPHVLQEVDELKGKNGNKTLTFYSLGNFLSTQLLQDELFGGIAIIDLSIEEELKIDNVAFLPTYMHYEWTRPEQQAQDLLARKNLKIYPLHKAQGPLTKSLLNTSVNAQSKRIKTLLNKNIPVEIIQTDNY